jgi:hypothetical protein
MSKNSGIINFVGSEVSRDKDLKHNIKPIYNLRALAATIGR